MLLLSLGDSNLRLSHSSEAQASKLSSASTSPARTNPTPLPISLGPTCTIAPTSNGLFAWADETYRRRGDACKAEKTCADIAQCRKHVMTHNTNFSPCSIPNANLGRGGARVRTPGPFAQFGLPQKYARMRPASPEGKKTKEKKKRKREREREKKKALIHEPRSRRLSSGNRDAGEAGNRNHQWGTSYVGRAVHIPSRCFSPCKLGDKTARALAATTPMLPRTSSPLATCGSVTPLASHPHSSLRNRGASAAKHQKRTLKD